MVTASKAGHWLIVIVFTYIICITTNFVVTCPSVHNIITNIAHGFVKDIMDVAPLAEKWRAFGWHTIEIDGNDIPALQSAFAEAAATKGKPTAIVANTIKGKGVSFMENNPKYHGTAPTPAEVQLALQELQ